MQISVAIFSTLLVHFRSQLKSEIGVFFPMMMLRVLETGSSLFQVRNRHPPLQYSPPRLDGCLRLNLAAREVAPMRRLAQLAAT